jgi:hypothetical protein
MSYINKNINDYNSNILSLLHQGSGDKEYSLDEIANYVESMIQGIFDRHYLRNRLFDLGRKGRISNPRKLYYRTPKPNPEMHLDIPTMWDEFIFNARVYKNDRSTFIDSNKDYWIVFEVEDSRDNAVVKIVNQMTQKKASISHEHFENSLVRINSCGGRMERPDRRISHRSAYCEFTSSLDFDEFGFTIYSKKSHNDDSQFISTGGIARTDGDWNVRHKRPIFNFDFEPSIIDQSERIVLTQLRHIRHEDLVDFVWNKILGERFDKKEGVFDLLCKNRQFDRIIWEMKTIQADDLIDEKRQVMKAISQLFYYDFKLGDAGIHPLIACFENKISLFHQEFLATCNILCCWRERNKLIFSDFLPKPFGITKTD